MFYSARLKVSISLLSVIVLTGLVQYVSAQQGSSGTVHQQVKVKVSRTESGKTVSHTQQKTVQGTANLNDILRENGIIDEFGDLADGEAVEIIIRRKMPATQAESIVVEVEPVLTKPAPAPVPEVAKAVPQPDPIATSRDFAYLGVRYSDLDASHPVMLGLPEVRGALVNTVLPGTSAEQNGLMHGDVLAAVNGQHLTEDRSIQDLISDYSAGDEVEVTFYRNEKKRRVVLVLGEVGNKQVYQYAYDNATGRVQIKAGNDAARHSQQDLESNLSKEMQTSPPMSSEPPYANVPAIDRAYMGVNGEAGDEDETEGARVSSVMRNSTGAALGLVKGDYITSLNGAPISKFADLGAAMDYIAPGDLVTVEVNRNGEMRSATARIKSKKETFQAPAVGEPAPKPAPIATSTPPAELQVEWETYREIKVNIAVMDATAQEAESISRHSGMDVSAQNSLNILDLTLFPNPNEGIFTLQFDLPATGDTEIRFFDANGKLIYAEDLPGFAGKYEKSLDFSDRDKGIYFLRIVQSDKPLLKKFVLQ